MPTKDWSGNAATCTSVVTVLQNSPVRNEGVDPQTASLAASKPFEIFLSSNPSSGEILLEFESPEDQEYQLRLMDLRGQLLLSEKLLGSKGPNRIPMQFKNTTPGIYLLELRSDQSRSIKRLVIQQ